MNSFFPQLLFLLSLFRLSRSVPFWWQIATHLFALPLLQNALDKWLGKPDNKSSMQAPTKPGYKTSELYVTVISLLLTFLATRGIIAVADVNPLLQAFIVVYAGGAGLLTIAHLTNKYVQARTSLKLQELPPPPLPAPFPPQTAP